MLATGSGIDKVSDEDLSSVLEQHGSTNGDDEVRASARLCTIISLVKQAELYNDIGQNSLSSARERVQYYSSCKECLSEVVAITAEFSHDDYYYLDPYLGVGASLHTYSSDR